MRTFFKHIACGVLLLSASATATAQEFRTSYFMQTSNFRHQMNPALLDSAYVTAILGNINAGATGNIGLANFVYKLEGNPNYDQTTFMNPTVSAAEFLGDLHDKNRADIYVNYNIASVGFKAFKGVNLVELNLRSNTHLCLPYELFDFMKSAGEKEHYTLNNLGVRTQNYLELALGHSHKINDKFTVGAKMKFLLGAAYADLSVNKLDLTMTGDRWAIEGDARLKAAVLNGNFTHDETKPLSADGRPRVDGLDDVSFGLPGFGLAFDFGATYKVIDDLTLSVGLTDLGFISWKNTLQASSQGNWAFDGFKNEINIGGENGEKLGDQFDKIGDDLEEMFAVYDDGKGTVKQGLAATLNIGAEYTLPAYRKLRFGFLYTSRIHGLYSFHQGMFSANVRPVKWLEGSLNTAVSSTGWTLGAALSLKAKHYNFYLGTDRFFGKVSKQYIPLHNLNANVTLGMTIPL